MQDRCYATSSSSQQRQPQKQQKIITIIVAQSNKILNVWQLKNNFCSQLSGKDGYREREKKRNVEI